MSHIERRGKKSWRLIVDFGYDSNGKRQQEKKTVRVSDEKILRNEKKLQEHLDMELAKFKLEIETGQHITPEKMSFERFVEDWWKPKYAQDEKNLSPRTYKNYCDTLEDHILPRFGAMWLDQIKTLHVVEFMAYLKTPEARKDGKDKPLSGGTQEFIYRVLKNVFKRAVNWKIIKENPVEGVEKPRPDDFEPDSYTEEEADQVIAALYKEPRRWRLLILGGLIGGFRRSELVGLQWPFVDFDECGLYVDRSISQTINGEAKEKGPKSKSGKRFVDMPEWYMREMKIHEREWKRERLKLQNAGKWLAGESEYVFHGGTGKPYYFDTPSKWWAKFCKRHDLRHIRFHDLRHTSASLLFDDDDNQDIDSLLKAIQKRLGHSRYQTSADIYVHLSKKRAKKTAQVYDKFDPKNNRFIQGGK